ncbi:marine proteobacterial sortase target protein [Alphaproteobacteria bacterium 46_93_T64]|nr:marine proteobacterial sortase target protein [Alphaproteobacteria bacterium 46_93_T64]
MTHTDSEKYEVGLSSNIISTEDPLLKGWPRLIRLLICLNVVGLMGIWIGNADAAARGAEFLLVPIEKTEGLDPTPVLAFITTTKIETVVTGHIVRSRVIQTFENPTAYWMEGKYSFPLPDGAAVDQMILKVGDRRIVSEIQEKQRAKRIYEEAAAAGKVSALLDQYRPNVFSTRVANIEPGSSVSVEISFQMLAEQNDASFSWIMPQTITPRYTPTASRENLTGEIQSETYQDTLAPVLTMSEFSVLFRQGDQISILESPSHTLVSDKLENGDIRVSLKDGTVPANRDFILKWKFEQGAVARALLFEEIQEEGNYMLGILLPPSENIEVAYVPRDITFILDISGSMQGEAITQGKEALIAAVENLRATDRFEIMAFNDNYYQLFGNSRSATPTNVRLAKQYVYDLQAERGTEMFPALKRALQLAQTDKMGRQIVFLTDGAVSNEEQMFELVDRKLKDARLFTVGLGQAPNSWFMRKAAEFGRGIHVQVDNINNAKFQLDKLFEDMSRPTLQKIQMDLGKNADTYPRLIPDLFGQRPLVFLSRRKDNSDIPSLKAIDGDGQLLSLNIDVQTQSSNASISKLWASKKIEGLMDAAARGMDIDIVRAGILKIALTHQIMSPYTSFVAVDKTPVRVQQDFLRKAKSALKSPPSLAWKKVHAPQTATQLEMSLWIGLGTFFLSGILFLIFFRRFRVNG